MELTSKVEKKVKEVFASDKDMQEKLLNLDLDAIRELGREANASFSVEDIIDCYETKTCDYLYKLAKSKKVKSELYFEFISGNPTPYSIGNEVSPFTNSNYTEEEFNKLDVETIKELGIYAKRGFTFDEVISNYESNSMDKLYEEAKKKLRYTDFYFKYLGEKQSEVRK